MVVNSSKHGIVAVVVTYQPELDVLERQMKALVPQVRSVVVVDNGSHTDMMTWSKRRQADDVKVLLLGENKGIAVAHNVGIQWALDNGAGFVLLMDQDSIPANNMVQRLMLALMKAEKKIGSAPIAAGPLCIDARTREKSLFLIQRDGMPTYWQPPESYIPDNFSLEVSFLISSGTLIDLKLLRSVGGMRSNYFIDHVDTEWCFRARAKGYTLLGAPYAEMEHTLGDTVTNFWFFGWHTVAYHSPLRDYYMFRNTLLMLRDVKMSFAWQLYLLRRLVKFKIYFLIFTPHRIHRFYCMVMGIIHGLRGISGKIDLKTFRSTQLPISDLDP